MAKTVTSEKIETPKFRAQFLLDPSNAEHAAAIKRIKSEAKRIAELISRNEQVGFLRRLWRRFF